MLSEVHRFLNQPVRVASGLHWDVLRLFHEIKSGLAACGPVAGAGLDTWGVDFGLLGRDDQLLGNPFHYRDARTEGMLARAFTRVPKDELYAVTGIQFLPFNSVYMLLSLEGTGLLDAARTFLTIPDLFNFWLCGVKANEYSNASTTQLLDVRTRGWSHDLIHRLGLPARVFQPIVEPGTVLGPLRAEVAAELGLAPYPIVAPACHDTGSAVVAVPAETADYAYISSGTWSLVGIESRRPLTGPEALAANLTNEGGAFGTVRVLKNVMGLWLIQECRRAWARAGHELSYAEIMAAASRATPGAVVDPDDPSFFAPGDMLAAIRDYCVRTGQAPPEGVGPVARCVFDSLARRYREVIDQLEALNGRRLEVIHIVGGGSQNTLLCQLTANTCGRPVIAGPTEGTALGNALVQLMALGELGSLDDTRRVLRASIETQVYRPAG